MEWNKIYVGNCLELMSSIPNNSVDMILCDLPYEKTAKNRWDKRIPIIELWKQYDRIIKDKGAVVLTAVQPFTSELVMTSQLYSDLIFRHEWIWEKPQGTGHLNANRQPLKNHENVLVFSKKSTVYNPQMNGLKRRTVNRDGKLSKTTNYRDYIQIKKSLYQGYYPKTILRFNRDRRYFHPTQKPVALFEYLIKTYSKKGDIILDNCIGSGTTAIACLRAERKFIGIDIKKQYVEIARQRILEEKKKGRNMKLGDFL